MASIQIINTKDTTTLLKGTDSLHPVSSYFRGHTKFNMVQVWDRVESEGKMGIQREALTQFRSFHKVKTKTESYVLSQTLVTINSHAANQIQDGLF